MVTLPLINSWTCDFVIFLSICDSMPNGSVYCFNHLYNLWVLTYIYGLVKSISERSLSGKKSQFLSKSGFAVTLGFTFHNLGYILSANKLAPLLGNESAYLPWENDKVWRKISVGKQEFYQQKSLYICPGDSIGELVQKLRSHSSFEKAHAR